MRFRQIFVLLAGLTLTTAAAWAAERGTYLYDPGGQVRSVRVVDVDADGRRDLVVLLETPNGEEQLLVLRTPATPVKRSFYPADHVTRIPCGGPRARAGAVAVGRFGPEGAVRVRFLGPDGVVDLTPRGTPAERTPRHEPAALFARSPGRKLVFWDGTADLNGDGRDECWYPLAAGDGRLRLMGGTAKEDRLLDLTTRNRAVSSHIHLLARHAYVPNLFPADLDGDGTRELLALRESTLVAWSLADAAGPGAALAPSYRVTLPFLETDPERSPEELRTPRIQIEDVDGDGKADLLVTLITGVRSRLTSIRTILFHYPGPFRDAASGKLVAPKARIDTQSIVLHPTFVDVDGDGCRDYVGDSIRGTMLDMIARMMGKNPEIHLVGFRYDKRLGTFARTPYFSVERIYAAKEALSNSFGRSAWFSGDFDGDGHADLLDLGDLGGVEIVRGVKGGKEAAFTESLLPRVAVKEGLNADAQVADLNGDKRADAVMWSDGKLYLVVSKGGGR